MYRIPFKTEEPKEQSCGFKYILIEKNQVHDYFYKHYCTICENINTSFDGMGFVDACMVCIPDKRVQFKSKFWQKKKFCPLDGYHKHYYCHYCGTTSILTLKSDDIIFVEVSR